MKSLAFAAIASSFVVVVASQVGCSSSTPTPAPAVDGGSKSDSGTVVPDAGESDTGAQVTALNGCNTADYVDRTATAADRTVVWGFNQTPKCMKVAAGQTVTFNGDFSQHPLVEKGGDTPNPFASPRGTGGTRTVAFPAAGDFGYECAVHPSITGAILVE